MAKAVALERYRYDGAALAATVAFGAQQDVEPPIVRAGLAIEVFWQLVLSL